MQNMIVHLASQNYVMLKIITQVLGASSFSRITCK